MWLYLYKGTPKEDEFPEVMLYKKLLHKHSGHRKEAFRRRCKKLTRIPEWFNETYIKGEYCEIFQRFICYAF